MPAKMMLSVYDNLHKKNAEGIEYDLWRVDKDSNRTNIKHATLTNDNSHVLVEANTEEELGAYEVILFAKDYFDKFNEDITMQDSRFTISFGMNELNQDYQLGVRITPDGYTCTL
ncbi:hypothetical protein I4U23_024777 [Adineta vaga]|nr:hypothetical protein I4U23_024777 [Adineta vaga]